MSTSSSHLFGGMTAEQYVDSARNGLKLRIEKVGSTAALDKLAEELDGSVIQRGCTLRRDQASFDVDNGKDGVIVDLTIPLEGEIRLLSVRPVDFAGIGPYATIDDGRWVGDDGPNVKLSKSFPPGTTQDNVRAWAKDEVDSIEARLASIQATLDEYNASAHDDVHRMIDARRQVLATSRSLRNDLGTGI